MIPGLPWLSADPLAPFPPAADALRQPDGLLAIGGDLSPARLLNAYRHGIFPWYGDDQPILWWSPDPRTVLRSDGVHLSSRFRRSLRRSTWQVCADSAFDEVIAACAGTPRHGQQESWITPDMHAAYVELHRLGHAHSIEVFEGTTLVGGLYGVAIGRMFFGESMFSATSGGSKVALAALALRLRQWGWPLIDAQVDNPHLRRMGAQSWPRTTFLATVSQLVTQLQPAGSWRQRFEPLAAAALAAGDTAQPGFLRE